MLPQDGFTRLYWLKCLIKLCMASVQLNVIKKSEGFSMVVNNLDSQRHIIDSSGLWWSMVVKVHILKQICLILMHFWQFLILSGIPCRVIPDFTHRRTDWGWLSTHGVAVHFKWPMNQWEFNISPEIWLAGFTVFVQQACQISLGYLLNRPHD